MNEWMVSCIQPPGLMNVRLKLHHKHGGGTGHITPTHDALRRPHNAGTARIIFPAASGDGGEVDASSGVSE